MKTGSLSILKTTHSTHQTPYSTAYWTMGSSR